MEHCIEKGVFGLGRKYVLGKVQPGDKIGCYVTKECKIIGLGEAISSHYLDDTPVFLGEGLYADRIDFKATALGKGHEIDFINVVDDMKFIKNVAYWSVYLSKGIVEITAADWNLLSSKAKHLTKS
jgi:predicted RNA-binding protein